MLQLDTPSPELLKEVRAHLVLKGTSLNAVAVANKMHRQAVSEALQGTRKGPKSRALAERFLQIVRELD